jgi:putative transposase
MADNSRMKPRHSMYKRHRFPPEIIQHAVWLYFRFNLSTRDVEDLLTERGIAVSYETIRAWCRKFGPKYARRLRRRHPGYGDTFFVDEVFIRIGGVRRYLWRAIDQDGEVVDVYLTEKRDAAAAKRFFQRILKASRHEPRRIISDKLASYNVAHRDLVPYSIRDTSRYANNQVERSHQEKRSRERTTRSFKSPPLAQRFLSTPAVSQNLFNLGRHHIRANRYRELRRSAFASWKRATAV